MVAWVRLRVTAPRGRCLVRANARTFHPPRGSTPRLTAWRGERSERCGGPPRACQLRASLLTANPSELRRLPEVAELRSEGALKRRPRRAALDIGGKPRVLRDDIRA